MIKISEQLSQLETKTSLGILTADVVISKSGEAVLELLSIEEDRVSTLTLETYRNETLEAARAIYKALGKDPSRYRISSDSLFRRLIKNKGMYYVNNVVDINNIISLKTLWSVGAYDLDEIKGEIVYGVGADELYEGIGRGLLNINKLPVLIDDIGPFGSATSDSLRTMVTDKTKRVMMVIHAFGEAEGLEDVLNEMNDYLVAFAQGQNININII